MERDIDSIDACLLILQRVHVIDTAGSTAVHDTECLATVRFLLLSSDAVDLPTVNTAPADGATSGASVVSSGNACSMVRHCLLAVADVLQSAGTHVYLSTTKLHRAMLMMVELMAELGASEGRTTSTTVIIFLIIILLLLILLLLLLLLLFNSYYY